MMTTGRMNNSHGIALEAYDEDDSSNINDFLQTPLHDSLSVNISAHKISPDRLIVIQINILLAGCLFCKLSVGGWCFAESFQNPPSDVILCKKNHLTTIPYLMV
mmetsp:Transcript_20652/g.41175  ORF Transcript_20652/g.41175 Transcript_20652/m.41175 type:complete len:104 (-) Transcript_20652:338-649(-)